MTLSKITRVNLKQNKDALSTNVIEEVIVHDNLTINSSPSIWHIKSIPREKKISYEGIEEITCLLQKYNVDPFRGNNII